MATHPAQVYHPDFQRRRAQWQKVRDAIEGEDSVKLAGQTYLPKPSAHDTTAYKAYLQRATFYAVTERTLRGLVGMVFRVDPVYTVPDAMQERLDNATPEGHSMDVWTQEIIAEVLTMGRYGILVDFPKEEVTAGTAPYFSPFFAEDIRNWSVTIKDGVKVLSRIVLTDDCDDTLGADVERVLELYLDEATGNYTAQRWECSRSKGGRASSSWTTIEDPKVPLVNGRPIDYIPFVFLSPYDLRPEVSKPPMLDLVNMNIAHFQNSADYEHALYLTAQPTPWIAAKLDEGKKPKAIGSGTIWYLPEGAQAGMLEFTGAGIEAQRKAMEDKETRMAVLGARLIKDNEATGNIAADTVRLKSRADTSVLTSTVRMVEQGLEKAFKIAVEWMAGNASEVKVVLNKDFVETRLDANELNGLVKAWQVGAISRTTLHENLQKGEIVAGDRTVEDEVSEIEQDGVGMGLVSLTPDQQLEMKAPPNDGTGTPQSGQPGGRKESQGGAASKAPADRQKPK